nr:MAG TPA: SWI/SNF complex subunit SMARCC1, SWI/SNF-related, TRANSCRIPTION [Caudoviricetes sp.]
MGTGLQGYRGREQSPPVPVPVPMDHQGHFPKSLSPEEERFCPSFCP